MRFTGLKYLQLLACLGLFACGSAERYDVVIVGGGASGTAAGLQAARMGARTLIVEECDWLGGMLPAAGGSARPPGRAGERETCFFQAEDGIRDA